MSEPRWEPPPAFGRSLIRALRQPLIGTVWEHQGKLDWIAIPVTPGWRLDAAGNVAGWLTWGWSEEVETRYPGASAIYGQFCKANMACGMLAGPQYIYAAPNLRIVLIPTKALAYSPHAEEPRAFDVRVMGECLEALSRKADGVPGRVLVPLWIGTPAAMEEVTVAAARAWLPLWLNPKIQMVVSGGHPFITREKEDEKKVKVAKVKVVKDKAVSGTRKKKAPVTPEPEATPDANPDP